MNLVIYHTSFPADAAMRIAESQGLRYDVGLYLTSAAKLDEEGNLIDAPFSQEEIRQLFGLERVFTILQDDFTKVDLWDESNKTLSALSHLVSEGLLCRYRQVQIACFIPTEPDVIFCLNFIERLLNMFDIKVRTSLAFSTKRETGILSEGLLELLPSLPYSGIRLDPDVVALVMFFHVLNSIIFSRDHKHLDFPLTISTVASIIQQFLPPVRGKHRGFQGTYKRLCEKAEELDQLGVLSALNRSRFTYYTLTSFGKAVAQVLQDENVQKLMSSSVQDAFFNAEHRWRAYELERLIKKSLRLGWVRP